MDNKFCLLNRKFKNLIYLTCHLQAGASYTLGEYDTYNYTNTVQEKKN